MDKSERVRMLETRFVATAPGIIRQAVGLSGYDELEGLGSFSIKSISSGFKHAIGVVKAAPKKKLEFLKTSIKDPKKAMKMLTAKRIQMHRETVKTGQKVAPVAAAIAAIYFGGPAIVGALKTAGGYAGTALKAASALSTAQKLVMQKKMAEVARRNPEEAAALQGQPPEVVLQSPLVQEAIAAASAEEVGQQMDATIESPEAQEMIGAQAEQAAGDMAVSAAAPQKSGAGVTAAAIGIPLILSLLR